MSLNRRQTLKALAVASTFPAFNVFARRAPDDLRDPLQLAARVQSTPHSELLSVARSAIEAGADQKTLLAAAFLAGVHDVRPRHVGGKLHCVMMIESAFQLSQAATEEERWLMALWALDDFKNSQRRDREDGDWELAPAPDVSFASEAAARKEFLAALEAWDVERADRALTGLLPFHGRESLFELLWPAGARCFAAIGHKIIYVAQVERTLARIGWRYAEPVLRALVYGLLWSPETDMWHETRELAPRLPADWKAGTEASDESLELARACRSENPLATRELVIAAFEAGLGPRTVWDAARLYASDVYLRKPQLLPVHTVTETNAFGYVARTTRSDELQRSLVLQAFAHLSTLRDELEHRIGLTMDGDGIETLGTERDAALATALHTSRPTAAHALLQAEALQAGFRKGLVRNLASKATAAHEYKYGAALLEDADFMAPQWRTFILAPAVAYMPTELEDETPFAARCKRLLTELELR